MLLEELIKRQRAAGLIDDQFAVLIGVDPNTWFRTRREMIPVRLAILRGAVRAFPDLGELTLAELAQDQPPRQRRRQRAVVQE